MHQPQTWKEKDHRHSALHNEATFKAVSMKVARNKLNKEGERPLQWEIYISEETKEDTRKWKAITCS